MLPWDMPFNLALVCMLFVCLSAGVPLSFHEIFGRCKLWGKLDFGHSMDPAVFFQFA